jgi:hypothetical protein
MTAAEAFVSKNLPTTQGLDLLGEIIAWNLPENTVVPYADLINYLRVAGLDEKVAREMRPRHAFARAAKQLAEQRIIRCIEDKPHKMRFQFTKEDRVGQGSAEFVYNKETILELDKDTGAILSEDGNSVTLVAEASRLLEKARNERLTADISRYIMVLFERQADLFPVRNAGGVYFVPQQHIAFVQQIQTLVEQLNGNVTRFPVPKGTQQGNKSVREAVQTGLQTLIEEHLKAVEDFGTDNRPSTLEKQVAKIEQTKFKIEAYAEYLGDQQDKLKVNLAAVSVNLQAKLAEVLKFRAEKGQNPNV